MKYAIKYYNDICIIELSGKVDFTASQFLNKIIENRINQGNFNIIVDFENIIYIGSNGLSVLINNLIKIKEKDGDLKISTLNSDIMEMMKNIKLDKVFDICPDLQSGIESFYYGGENDKS
ncbi:MAG: STAS domain-containing protein [Candidatus Muiribacteriota bacterium]